MHDKQNKAGIWMIDFAKTLRVEGRKLSHRAPWVVGNHEDGYLTGVAHLTEVRLLYNHVNGVFTLSETETNTERDSETD